MQKSGFFQLLLTCLLKINFKTNKWQQVRVTTFALRGLCPLIWDPRATCPLPLRCFMSLWRTSVLQGCLELLDGDLQGWPWLLGTLPSSSVFVPLRTARSLTLNPFSASSQLEHQEPNSETGWGNLRAFKKQSAFGAPQVGPANLV